MRRATTEARIIKLRLLCIRQSHLHPLRCFLHAFWVSREPFELQTPNRVWVLSIAVSFSTQAIPYNYELVERCQTKIWSGSHGYLWSQLQEWLYKVRSSVPHLLSQSSQRRFSSQMVDPSISVVLRCPLHAMVIMILNYEGLFWGYILQGTECTRGCVWCGGDPYTIILCAYSGFQLHLNVTYCVQFHR